jgi:hypothetical protein
MRFPKFWKDSGGGNELIISLCMLLGIVIWGTAGRMLGLFWLTVASIVLGPLSGFLIGFVIVGVLVTYFGVEDR